MELKKIIATSIENVNRDLRIPELDDLNEETPLFEYLDSLGTLDLILELENNLRDIYGTYIAVANEESMDYHKTPFRTIQTLETFLQQRIDDGTNQL